MEKSLGGRGTLSPITQGKRMHISASSSAPKSSATSSVSSSPSSSGVSSSSTRYCGPLHSHLHSFQLCLSKFSICAVLVLFLLSFLTPPPCFSPASSSFSSSCGSLFWSSSSPPSDGSSSFPRLTFALGADDEDDSPGLGRLILTSIGTKVAGGVKRGIGKITLKTSEATREAYGKSRTKQALDSMKNAVHSAFSGSRFVKVYTPEELITAWGPIGTGSSLFLQASYTATDHSRALALRTVRSFPEMMELSRVYTTIWSKFMQSELRDRTHKEASEMLETYIFELLQEKMYWRRRDIAQEKKEDVFQRVMIYTADFEDKFFRPYIVKMVRLMDSDRPWDGLRAHVEDTVPRLKMVVLLFIDTCDNHPDSIRRQDCFKRINTWNSEITAIETALLKTSSNLCRKVGTSIDQFSPNQDDQHDFAAAEENEHNLRHPADEPMASPGSNRQSNGDCNKPNHTPDYHFAGQQHAPHANLRTAAMNHHQAGNNSSSGASSTSSNRATPTCTNNQSTATKNAAPEQVLFYDYQD
eukprot:GHVT01020884.1.p1 GENE.GHVT01020884.1~~GHVT01020884.1.p1  ORF type:complete len:527 (-),score=70.87 GHVT01020884.1:1058-2638(-)